MLAIKTLTPHSIIFRQEARIMGDRFEISVVSDDPHWAEDRIADAISEISRVEKLLSVFNEESAVNLINRNAGIAPVKVDGEVFKLIERSLQIAELTHGAFDITYYAAEKSFITQDDTPVKISAKKAANRINFQSVALDAKAQTVFLKEPGMRIGFGANSKGYAADRAKYMLLMQGVRSGVINAGGDLLAWGTQPDNAPWTVATADPSQKAQPFANIDISNMAIATSVSVQKNTAVINKKYPGTINPDKGFPVSDIKSASVISTSAEFADAMAAPVIAMGINAGLYLINKLNQIACIIVDDQDRIYSSKDVNIVN